MEQEIGKRVVAPNEIRIQCKKKLEVLSSMTEDDVKALF
jgi:hypothetical protein